MYLMEGGLNCYKNREYFAHRETTANLRSIFLKNLILGIHVYVSALVVHIEDTP